MQPRRQPVFCPDPRAGDWVLVRPLRVKLDGKVIDIPAGFRCDLASIPRFAWTLVGHPATPAIELPATVHDWLYATGDTSRRYADKAFLVLMRKQRVEKSWLKWLAVRLFGWAPWYLREDGARIARAPWIARPFIRVGCWLWS